MNERIMPAFYTNLDKISNSYNTRSQIKFDSFRVPKTRTAIGSKRLSVFLPNFINEILKNSYNLKFVEFKEHIANNVSIFYDNFIKCMKNC